MVEGINLRVRDKIIILSERAPSVESRYMNTCPTGRPQSRSQGLNSSKDKKPVTPPLVRDIVEKKKKKKKSQHPVKVSKNQGKQNVLRRKGGDGSDKKGKGTVRNYPCGRTDKRQKRTPTTYGRTVDLGSHTVTEKRHQICV